MSKATLADDCKAIVDGYRVFALRAPQTHLVIGADAETAAIAALDQVVPKLSTAIDQAAGAGKVLEILSDDPLRGLLDGARSSVKAGAADLKAARADVKTITSTVKA